MFTELKEYAERCDLNITISYKLDLMTVIVLPKCKEEQFQLQPIVATGTPEEFDANFIASLKSMLEPLAQKMDKLKIDAKAFDESVQDIDTEKKPAKKVAAKASSAPKEEKPKEPTLKELVAAGEEAMKLKDYVKAVESFTKAVALKPDDKKVKEKLVNAERWKKAQDDLFSENEQSAPKEESLKEKIEEIAKESPNIIIAKVAPVEFVEPTIETEQPADENFGDDDFSL